MEQLTRPPNFHSAANLWQPPPPGENAEHPTSLNISGAVRCASLCTFPLRGRPLFILHPSRGISAVVTSSSGASLPRPPSRNGTEERARGTSSGSVALIYCIYLPIRGTDKRTDMTEGPASSAPPCRPRRPSPPHPCPTQRSSFPSAANVPKLSREKSLRAAGENLLLVYSSRVEARAAAFRFKCRSRISLGQTMLSYSHYKAAQR
jgi:hypothetical protein